MTDPTPADDHPDEPPTLPGPGGGGLVDPSPTQPYLPPTADPEPTPTFVPFDPSDADPSPTATLEPDGHPRADLRPGRIPGYELLEVVGYGGLGAVYRARHLELGVEVAIKVVYGAYSRLAQDPKIHAVLHRLARLRHPNLVATYGHGRRETFPFLVMEYVAGRPLHRVFDGPTRPDFRETARLLEEVAHGVAYLHGEGILHRDVKPGNILVEGSGRVRLTDYGLAMLWPTAWADDDPERPLPVVGTPAFMAPEQALGNLAAFGPTLDVWALGATFFWMLTGEHLFQREAVIETLMAVVHEEPPSPRSRRPEVPADLETICMRCLRRDPAKRYPSAAALAADLARYRAGERVAPRPRRPWWAFWRSE